MSLKRKLCIEDSPGTPSLRRRTLISSTPLEPAIEYVNDDNSERQQLREINKFTPRKTLKLSSDTNGESLAIVFDKLSSIIQMSNAKKINPNNVWKIQASAYLQRIATGNCTDFQFLATALSATVHIYDMKVSDLHSIVMKFANNLLETAPEAEANVGNEQGNIENESKKKHRRRVKVTADPDSLRGKPKLYDKPSQLFYKAKHHAENFMSSKNNFQAFLDTHPENLDYILDSEVNYWEQISKVAEPDSKDVNWIHVNNAPTPEEIKKTAFCPEFETFSFLNWNSEDNSRALEDFQLKMRNSAVNYVFDMDAEAQPIDNSVDNEMDHDDIEVFEDVLKEAPISKNIEFLVDMRPHHNDPSNKFLEYSFRPVPGAWAGPSYWKLKGNINRVLKKSETDCPIRPLRKKKERKSIDFNDTSVIQNIVYNKSKLTLAILKKNTALFWTRDAVTLPRNYFIKLADLFPLQMNKRLLLRPDNQYVSSHPNDSNSSYHNNKLNDSQYVANPDNENENNIECHVDFPQNEDSNNNDGPLELIDAPFLVPKLAIDYARKAKFVDMKNIQQSALNVLKLFAKKENSTNITFSNVFVKLKKQMPEADLSYGIVFSAVLHLCNQHGLRLQQHEDLKDITVLNVPEN